MTSTRNATIVLMGPTGTGKSSFINLLTNDKNIRIGHALESQTFEINSATYDYVGNGAAVSVTLVDTPGFDDSRDGVSDTDILRKIADFLQSDGGRQINGIIYLHRISDPRMGGQAKKNLRLFEELCGEEILGNVRVVTTYWGPVDPKLGCEREEALSKGAFKSLIDGGAKLLRHDRGIESAQEILSELVFKEPVVTKLQGELADGKALGDTSAGSVIVEEIKALQKKHDTEMEDLLRELQDAMNAEDEGLKAELTTERLRLEQKMVRAEEDSKSLELRPWRSTSQEEASLFVTTQLAPQRALINTEPEERRIVSLIAEDSRAEQRPACTSNLEKFVQNTSHLARQCGEVGKKYGGNVGLMVGFTVGAGFGAAQTVYEVVTKDAAALEK